MLSLATLVLVTKTVSRDTYSSSRVTGNVAGKLSQNLHHQPMQRDVDEGLSAAVHATDSAIAHLTLKVGQKPTPPSPVFHPPSWFCS